MESAKADLVEEVANYLRMYMLGDGKEFLPWPRKSYGETALAEFLIQLIAKRLVESLIPLIAKRLDARRG